MMDKTSSTYNFDTNDGCIYVLNPPKVPKDASPKSSNNQTFLFVSAQHFCTQSLSTYYCLYIYPIFNKQKH